MSDQRRAQIPWALPRGEFSPIIGNRGGARWSAELFPLQRVAPQSGVWGKTLGARTAPASPGVQGSGHQQPSSSSGFLAITQTGHRGFIPGAGINKELFCLPCVHGQRHIHKTNCLLSWTT